MFFFLFAFVACNNASDTGKNNKTDSPARKESSWTKDDENEFLAGCVDNAKSRYSEDTAYFYCKCVLEKLKQHFPNADSAEAALKDSISAAQYTQGCQ